MQDMTTRTLEPDCLNSDPTSAILQLCNLVQNSIFGYQFPPLQNEIYLRGIMIFK